MDNLRCYNKVIDLLVLTNQLQKKAGNLTEEEKKRLDIIDKITEQMVKERKGS